MKISFGLSTVAIIALAVSAPPARADGPMTGATGAFELDYLQFILDHHYSGLRATELAAGTAVVGPTFSAPYPGNPASFPPTPAKGTNPVVLSVATMANLAQGMEIVEGQTFLQNWYGLTASLDIRPDGQMMINMLEAAAPGDPFNIAFLSNFGDHHVSAIERSLECINRAGHAELRSYCQNIVTAQTRETQEMRAELARTYGIVDNDPPLPAAAVPEPSTWAMLIAGFGLVGGAMRSRRRKPGSSRRLVRAT